MGYNAIILAAGKGTRMKSLTNDTCKVCFKVLDKPMVEYVYDALTSSNIKDIVAVVGHQAKQVIEILGKKVTYAYQTEQKGTGHAIMQAIPYLKDSNPNTVIVCGDTPLLTTETIKGLCENHRYHKCAATILEAEVDNPYGYGRLVKDNGILQRIVEQKDASPEEAAINTINTGVYVVKTEHLKHYINLIEPNNNQHEYYLTDIFKLMIESGLEIGCYKLKNEEEFLGINDRVQLSIASKIMQTRINNYWMLQGVTLCDPTATYIGKDVIIGNDTTIYPNTIIFGKCVIGDNCIIGPNLEIVDKKVDNNSVLKKGD